MSAPVPGRIAADAEERWFDELDTAMDEWFNLVRQFEAAPKSERDDLARQVHEAKRDIIERFYAQGMGAL